MKLNLEVQLQPNETQQQAMARVVTTPECLSAFVLTICQNIERSEITQMAEELSRQTKLVRGGDMARVESMLLAQAHTLDGLFAKLTKLALTTGNLGELEQYMRLALRSQNQARATLQTLAEMKAPRQVAFVQQANIGNQVQVNNDTNTGSRAGKKQNPQNELLEKQHGERLDTGKAGAAGRVDSTVAAVAQEYRSQDCWR